MPENPSPTVAPYLLYEDATAALEWLIDAFGAEERMRIPDATGAVTHAEVMIGDGQIMLGAPGGDYQSPAHSGHVHVQVYAYVDDVDSHFERARAAGATILEEPSDQFYGDRRYGVADLEGHHWYFATHVRDVSPEEMQAGATAGD